MRSLNIVSALNVGSGRFFFCRWSFDGNAVHMTMNVLPLVHLSYFHSLLLSFCVHITRISTLVPLTVHTSCIRGIWITFIIDSHLRAIIRKSIMAKLVLRSNDIVLYRSPAKWTFHPFFRRYFGVKNPIQVYVHQLLHIFTWIFSLL